MSGSRAVWALDGKGGQALQRLLSGLLVLLASATVTFFALRLTPGDQVRAVLGGPTANPTPETIAQAIKEFGLDKSLFDQYLIHISRILRGDLGISFSQHQPVMTVIVDNIAPTLVLTGGAIVVAWLISLASTLLTASRSRVLSNLGSSIETVLAALPQFWLGLVLLAAFAFGLGLFPAQSNDSVSGLVLPILALALPLAGFIGQVSREAFEIAMEQPFILSARTRGLRDGQVRRRHALRHALLPGVSLTAWAVGSLIGNAVLIETIFSRPGLGRVLYQAVTVQDMPLTIGVTLFVTLVYIIASWAVDVLYVIIDPRIQEKRA